MRMATRCQPVSLAVPWQPEAGHLAGARTVPAPAGNHQEKGRAMSQLALENVNKSFGNFGVIHDINLQVMHGEFVVFVGPSGCGKSTLLRMIAGLETISDGNLLIDDQRMNEVPSAKRGIAMVFQSYALYPHMNVYQNMAFSLETARMRKAEIEQRVRRAAAILQLDPLLSRKPKELSGGQRQRVAIGRAIVREPGIFLFDEPLSNLDAELRVQMRVEIAKLHRDLACTMIYVTHDQVEAMTLADKIVVLRAGRVEQVGTPLELYNHPSNQFVAGFIGSPKMNFFNVVSAPGEGARVLLGSTELALPHLARVDSSDLTLGIRPEHLSIREGGLLLGEAQVQMVEQLGGSSFIYGALPDGQPVAVQLEGQQQLARGDAIPLFFRPDQAHLFLPDGAACNRVSDFRLAA
jgi:multiple sugar transport system ATP-binding protein